MSDNNDAPDNKPKAGLPPIVPNPSIDAANMVAIHAHHKNVTAALTGVQATARGGIMGIEIHGPLPAGHKFYAVVGQIASDWARVELVLDTIIWHLAAVELRRGACMTAQMIGVRSRCLTMLALAEYEGLSKDTKDKITTFMNKSGGVIDDRNRAVHDPWYLEQIKQEVAQHKSMPKGELKYGYVPRSETELQAIIDRIERWLNRATTLKTEILNELQLLREKPK